MLDPLSWEFAPAVPGDHHWYRHGRRTWRCSWCGATCHHRRAVGITCAQFAADEELYRARMARLRAVIALRGLSWPAGAAS